MAIKVSMGEAGTGGIFPFVEGDVWEDAAGNTKASMTIGGRRHIVAISSRALERIAGYVIESRRRARMVRRALPEIRRAAESKIGRVGGGDVIFIDSDWVSIEKYDGSCGRREVLGAVTISEATGRPAECGLAVGASRWRVAIYPCNDFGMRSKVADGDFLAFVGEQRDLIEDVAARKIHRHRIPEGPVRLWLDELR